MPGEATEVRDPEVFATGWDGWSWWCEKCQDRGPHFTFRHRAVESAEDHEHV